QTDIKTIGEGDDTQTLLWGNGTIENGLIIIPSNFCSAGKTIRIKANGIVASNPTLGGLNITIQLGDTTLGTTGYKNLNLSNIPSKYWDLENIITCTNATAVLSVGRFQYVSESSLGEALNLELVPSVIAPMSIGNGGLLNVTAGFNSTYLFHSLKTLTASVEVLN
ncbi:MAG: hypothetical protein WD512_06970, partial [Candidatus Paceibacterota bacterium]